MEENPNAGKSKFPQATSCFNIRIARWNKVYFMTKEWETSSLYKSVILRIWFDIKRNCSFSAGDDDDVDIEYDADGNPIAPVKSKYIDPLPPIDHSKIVYKPFEKNFYVEHTDITGLSPIQVRFWPDWHSAVQFDQILVDMHLKWFFVHKEKSTVVYLPICNWSVDDKAFFATSVTTRRNLLDSAKLDVHTVTVENLWYLDTE